MKHARVWLMHFQNRFPREPCPVRKKFSPRSGFTFPRRTRFSFRCSILRRMILRGSVHSEKKCASFRTRVSPLHELDCVLTSVSISLINNALYDNETDYNAQLTIERYSNNVFNVSSSKSNLFLLSANTCVKFVF